MNVLRISQRWAFASVLLAILAFGTAEGDPFILLVGITSAFTAWLATRGSPPKAAPKLFINTLLFGVIAWGTWNLLQGGLGVSLFSKFVTSLMIIKLLDRKTTRDTALLLTLSVFLIIGSVLTSNAFLLGVLVLVFLPVFIVSVLWYQLSRVDPYGESVGSAGSNKPRGAGRVSKAVWKRTFAIVAASIPIGVVVFLLIPRELGSKSLGSWGTASLGSTVGFNDEVRLGMGGLISQSQEPVLDMQLFDRDGQSVGDIGQRFYLRGAILHDYDPETGTWARPSTNRYAYQDGPAARFGPAFVPVGGKPSNWTLRQEITIRSTAGSKGHLFSIWRTNQVRVTAPAQLQFNPRDSALRVNNHQGKVSYTIYSNDQLPLPANYAQPIPLERLEPVIDNQAVRTIAVNILTDAGLEPDPIKRPVSDDLNAVSTLRNALTGGAYVYTLDTLSAPPGRDPVEWFLTQNKEGHCEYFASSLALMCRTVGIDARVITGFVATDYNEATSSYIVRASNAHAWIEAETLPGDWRTFDPTPTADLTRIHEPPHGLLADARRLLNTMEFAWIRTVIGYDAQARKEFLGREESESVSMFPILDRLSRATRKAKRAPLNTLLIAGRNGLIAFCFTVLAGVGFARYRGLIGGAFRRMVSRLRATIAGRPERSSAQRTRDELIGLYRRGGRAKPAWVTLGVHTSELVSSDELSGEAAQAATRIVDRLYAAYFAGRSAEDISAMDADMRTVRAWSRRRAPARREHSNGQNRAQP